MTRVLTPVLTLGLLLLSACGDGSGDDGAPAGPVGTWELDAEAIKSHPDADASVKMMADAIKMSMTFKEDGTFSGVAEMMGTEKTTGGKWEMDGADLKLTWDKAEDGKDMKMTYEDGKLSFTDGKMPFPIPLKRK